MEAKTVSIFYILQNESKGVTKDRVYAFRLTTGGSEALAGTQHSPTLYKQYLSIYGTSTGTVNTNNTLYDETPGSKITNNVFQQHA